MNMDDFMKSGRYLPDFMRDFDNQKRLFRRIDEIVERRKEMDKKGFLPRSYPSWVDAHIYVIDFFLWFMARRGYTLQKSRKKIDFIDIESDLQEFDKRELQALSDMISDMQKAA